MTSSPSLVCWVRIPSCRKCHWPRGSRRPFSCTHSDTTAARPAAIRLCRRRRSHATFSVLTGHLILDPALSPWSSTQCRDVVRNDTSTHPTFVGRCTCTGTASTAPKWSSSQHSGLPSTALSPARNSGSVSVQSSDLTRKTGSRSLCATSSANLCACCASSTCETTYAQQDGVQQSVRTNTGRKDVRRRRPDQRRRHSGVQPGSGQLGGRVWRHFFDYRWTLPAPRGARVEALRLWAAFNASVGQPQVDQQRNEINEPSAEAVYRLESATPAGCTRSPAYRWQICDAPRQLQLLYY